MTNMSGTAHGTRSETDLGTRSEQGPRAREPLLSSEVHTSPDLRTSVSTHEPGPTNPVIRSITYADALVRVIAELRPYWDLDKVRHEVVNDPRPNGIAAPAAIFAACDRAIHEPGAITHYQPPTYTPPRPTPDIRAPKCPHGVLADPDGRGAGCEGCGTRAVPMPPGLRATATPPMRHTAEVGGRGGAS